MKKIFTLLLAMGSLTAVFAQSGRYNSSKNGSAYQSNNYGRNNSYNNNTAYYSNQDHDNYSGGQNWGANDQRSDNRGGYVDRGRNDGRDMNRDDRRADQYRDDHFYNSYDRNQRAVIVQPQRRTDLGAVAGGMIIGGILGAILSH